MFVLWKIIGVISLNFIIELNFYLIFSGNCKEINIVFKEVIVILLFLEV